VSVWAFLAPAPRPRESSDGRPRHEFVVIAASRVFDGKGGVLGDTRIVVGNSKIVALDPTPARWTTTCAA
jgi:hypothetical protein